MDTLTRIDLNYHTTWQASGTEACMGVHLVRVEIEHKKFLRRNLTNLK